MCFMKRETLAVAVVAGIALWYLSFPLLLSGGQLVGFELVDVRRDKSGIRVDFNVTFTNKGIWPVRLSNIEWEMFGGSKVGRFRADLIRPLSSEVTIPPLQRLTIPAFLTYKDPFEAGYYSGYSGVDISIRRVTVNVKGTMQIFGFSSLVPSDFAWGQTVTIE